MDNTPQQVAKKFLAELQAIGVKLQQLIEAIREQDNADKKYTEITPHRTIAELETPVPISVQAETHESKSKWKTAKTICEIVGIAAVVIYSILTYTMWLQVKRSNNIAQESMEKQERAFETTNGGAYLTVYGVSRYLYPDLPPDKVTAVVQFHIFNMPTEIKVFINVDSRSSPPTDFPDAPETDPIQTKHCISVGQCAASTISPRQLSKQGYTDFIEGRNNLYIWGFIEYTDAIVRRKVNFWHCISSADYEGLRRKYPGRNHYDLNICKEQTSEEY